jgi:hypothetical protein
LLEAEWIEEVREEGGGLIDVNWKRSTPDETL